MMIYFILLISAFAIIQTNAIDSTRPKSKIQRVPAPKPSWDNRPMKTSTSYNTNDGLDLPPSPVKQSRRYMIPTASSQARSRPPSSTSTHSPKSSIQEQKPLLSLPLPPPQPQSQSQSQQHRQSVPRSVFEDDDGSDERHSVELDQLTDSYIYHNHHQRRRSGNERKTNEQELDREEEEHENLLAPSSVRVPKFLSDTKYRLLTCGDFYCISCGTAIPNKHKC